MSRVKASFPKVKLKPANASNWGVFAFRMCNMTGGASPDPRDGTASPVRTGDL